MSEERRLIGEILEEIVAAGGGPAPVRLGLMAYGSELGQEELITGARLALKERGDLSVVLIGPRHEAEEGMEWIETPPCESDVVAAMESALQEGRIDGAVALHYPFPLGVATVGRVVAPGTGRELLIATSTGTTATERVEAMVKNALIGRAVARALGKKDPTLAVLNVEGAQAALRILRHLAADGYPLCFGSSGRSDGGALLRGNDLLSGAVDICLCDTLTGNVLVKLFSAFTTGGSRESLGWGYGPSAGEGWSSVVSIISRASGAPVVAGALAYTARVVRGRLPRLVEEEFALARKAGLEKKLERTVPVLDEAVTVPPSEPTDDEIHGIDVLSMEEAVRRLWKEGIFAESAMGCTGPVVKIASSRRAQAEACLREEGLID
ncbi:MAG: glycine reductase [Synergistaceae bacterium]|nr:glycine reductase [Synergistaceae bacterium]